MTPLVSQLWPQFMADPAFASCFGQVIVEHARMLRQSQQVIFTLRSAAPLDKGLCARLLMQVHDELIVECPVKGAEQVKKIVTAEMENVVQLKVPLLAEAKSGASWYEAK